MHANRRQRLFLAVLLALFLILSACTPAAADPTATTQPTDTAPPPTATAVPPTETPVPPTDTPEPSPTPLPTETPTATLDLAATASYESTQAASAVLETVYEALEAVNYSADSGQLAWSSADVVDLRISTFNTYDLWPIDDGAVYSNFVLKTDVTWESTSGLAICGVVFRSGPNLSEDEYYIFQTIRLSGLPSWDVEYWKFNQWVSTVTGSIINAPVIDQDNGSTNEFVLVADGDIFTAYANGTRLGSAPVSSLSEGMIGFYVWSESGQTSCAFSNTWLWALNEE